MNTKPTRNFIIFWMLLIALFVGGLTTVLVLSRQNNAPMGDYFTGTAISATNKAVASNLTATQSAEAQITPVSGISSPTRTPIPYDASMSPTAPISPEQATHWIATMTAWTFRPTRTPIPYDASMSPTVPISPQEATHWAQTMTAQAFSPTPTLCPASDVICPGGNATLSPAQQVMELMASASAPEFGQLAQTATAYAVSPTPSPTAAVHDSNCVFNWARQDLPEVTTRVQTALDDAGIGYVSARAEAYGENCYRADQTVSYFAAMTTDFYLTIPLDNLADEDFMGQIVAASYKMLVALPEDSLPARLGYLDITFSAGEQNKHFRAMFPTLRPHIEAGETGAELLAVGRG